MSDPRQGEERFSDWVDGCMSDRDRERFEAEMRVNARLLQEAEAFRRTVTTVQQALRQDPARADIADRVMAALRQPAVTTVPRPVRSLRSATWLLGLSAAAALLLTAALLQQWQPLVSPPSQQPVARVDQPAPKPALMDDLEPDAGPGLGFEHGDPNAWSRDAKSPEQSAAGEPKPSAPGNPQADAADRRAPAPQEASPKQEQPMPDATTATGALKERSALRSLQQAQQPASDGGQTGAGDRAEPLGAGATTTPAATPPPATAPAAPPRLGRGGGKAGSSDLEAGRDGDAGVARGDTHGAAKAAEPVVQTLVVTRQLAAPAAAADERAKEKDKDGRESKKVAAANEPAERTGSDEFFLGSFAKRDAEPPAQAWLFQFMQPGDPGSPGLAAASGLSVQTLDLQGLLAADLRLDTVQNERIEVQDIATRTRKDNDDSATSARRELLQRLAPPRARTTRLALVEGDSGEVRQLIGEVRKLAERSQLGFDLQELPVSVLTDLQQRAAARQQQKPADNEAAGAEAESRGFRPQAPSPQPTRSPQPAGFAAQPGRMRIAILFRELPPVPEKH